MSLLLFFIVLVGAMAVLWFVLPQMPQWARVGFWAVLCLVQIATNDAFFAAIYAAIATSEFYRS